MRLENSGSPAAGNPLAPSGFGVDQVPEASITARASAWLVPFVVSIESTKGRASRSVLTTLSIPWREMAVTRVPASMTDAISGVAASGARYRLMRSPPVGSVSSSGTSMP